MHNPSRFTGRLVAIEEVTHDISEFRFETDSGQVFEPGQFALIDVPGVDGARAYSMCNVGGTLVIGISKSKKSQEVRQPRLYLAG